MRRRTGRTGRAGWTIRLLYGAVVLVAIYIGFRRWPGILFPHTVSAGNVVLHARRPLPDRAKDIAEAVRARVSRSPFYVQGDAYDVYLTDSPALFAFFALTDYKAGALADVYVSGNVFTRPVHIERDRLVGASGVEAGPDRPLSYFIAHEITHLMVARRVGRRGYSLLETWQREGYADYVGRGDLFDFDAMRRALVAGQPELDPKRSGLYFRYHLLVADLLDHRSMTPGELLSKPRDATPIEKRLTEPRTRSLE